MKYTLKAFRGSSTFSQTFTNHDAMLDKQAWLVANGFTIGSVEDVPARTASSVLVYGLH